MMTRTVQETQEWLSMRECPSEGKATSTFRQGLRREPPKKGKTALASQPNGPEEMTPQSALRGAILRALFRCDTLSDGMNAWKVLANVEKYFDGSLSQADLAETEEGLVTWQMNVVREALALRREGLLRQACEATPGMWALTEAGITELYTSY